MDILEVLKRKKYNKPYTFYVVVYKSQVYFRYNRDFQICDKNYNELLAYLYSKYEVDIVSLEDSGLKINGDVKIITIL